MFCLKECGENALDVLFGFEEGAVYSDYPIIPFAKAMLAWWVFLDESQELLSLETAFEIEHIYAKSRQDKEKSLTNAKNLEALGNKAMLEKRINIRASDYRFEDKKKY